MALQLPNLDQRTREFMLEEFEQDAIAGRLYLSARFTDAGRRAYPQLLRDAIQNGNDATLAAALRSGHYFAETEQRRKPSGGFTSAKVPVTAPETTAEGEFNRFYIRGVCRGALEDGVDEVVVFRAKQVERPRPDSEAKIDNRVPAQRLLEDLRANIGVDTALGLPSGPNSGLSVRLP